MATTTLDNLISESGRKTGIGAAAVPLTRDLLRLMTGGAGGLSGFLDRFRSAGFGAEIASFLGGRSDTPLPPTAVDTVIGESTVANMAQRAGVIPSAARTAMGFEIPRLIGLLTPGGTVPTVLPSEIQTFVGKDEQVPPIATATIRGDEQVPPIATATIRPDEQVRPAAMATLADRRSLGWLWALLALVVLSAFLWALLSRNRLAPVRTAQITPPAVAPPTVTPPVAAAPSAVTVEQLTRTFVTFPTGSSVLAAGSAPVLRRAADQINSMPAGSVVEIGGHADNTGNAASNVALSQRRADAVRTALVQDGVDPSRLVAKGYGDTQPVASNDTSDGRLQNRGTGFTLVTNSPAPVAR